MIHKGDIVVVRDPDLLDMYTGEAMRDEDERKRNVLVRIRTMLRYPIQHAIIRPDCASENPPIAAGAVCRLEYVRTVETRDRAYSDYEATRARCLEEYHRRRKRLYDADEARGDRPLSGKTPGHHRRRQNQKGGARACL